MPIKFAFPKLDPHPERARLFPTRPPSWDDKTLKQWADTFDLDGSIEHAGDFFLLQGQSAQVHLFKDSGSLRWTRRAHQHPLPEDFGKLPPDEVAMAMADQLLASKGLADPQAKRFPRVEYTRVTQGDGNDPRPVEVHVSYGFSLGGVPVLGPGAKMRVTFGSDGQPVELYKFWREPSSSRALPGKLLPDEKILSMLQAERSWASFQGEGTVTYDRIFLAYFAAPPSEKQTVLLPVFTCMGRATVAQPHGGAGPDLGGVHPAGPPAGDLQLDARPRPFVRHVLAVDPGPLQVFSPYLASQIMR